MERQSVKDKVVIVTGAGQGLGEAIAQVLGEAGAIVCGCDIKEDQMKKVAKAVSDAGGRAGAYVMDVRSEKDVIRTVDRIMKDYGRIDVLVNNAGTDVTLSVENLSIADWDRVLDVNLRGPFLCAKAVYPILKRQGRGAYREYCLHGRQACLDRGGGLSRQQMGVAWLQSLVACGGPKGQYQGHRRDRRRNAHALHPGTVPGHRSQCSPGS